MVVSQAFTGVGGQTERLFTQCGGLGRTVRLERLDKDLPPLLDLRPG